MSGRDQCAKRGIFLAADLWGGVQIRLKAPDYSVGPPAYLLTQPPTRLRVPA